MAEKTVDPGSTPPEQPDDSRERIQIRGDINLDRLRAILEKAGGKYTLQIAVRPPETEADSATEEVVCNEKEGE